MAADARWSSRSPATGSVLSMSEAVAPIPETIAGSAVIYLVRHGAAESRKAWDHDDSLRPLTKKGRRQAAGLVGLLGETPIVRVLSSPSRRCIQTVEPVAAAFGLDVETTPELLEGSPARAAVEIVRRQARGGPGTGGPGTNGAASLGTSTVVCTHGDLIPGILGGLRSLGLRLVDQGRWAKGSTWVITGDGEHFGEARYLPPPGH